jgi:hypothetical protein
MVMPRLSLCMFSQNPELLGLIHASSGAASGSKTTNAKVDDGIQTHRDEIQNITSLMQPQILLY